VSLISGNYGGDYLQHVPTIIYKQYKTRNKKNCMNSTHRLLYHNINIWTFNYSQHGAAQQLNQQGRTNCHYPLVSLIFHNNNWTSVHNTRSSYPGLCHLTLWCLCHYCPENQHDTVSEFPIALKLKIFKTKVNRNKDLLSQNTNFVWICMANVTQVLCQQTPGHSKNTQKTNLNTVGIKFVYLA